MNRDEAIKEIDNLRNDIGSAYDDADQSPMWYALGMAIEALRERKTGKWVLSPVDGQLHCSACNRLLWGVAIMALGGLPNACPWCCAEMEVDDG